MSDNPASGEHGDTARLTRERDFHDDRYADETRLAARRFYSVTRASQAALERELATLRPGDRALEYGCGIASRAFDLAARGVLVSGIDISPVAIEASEEEAARRGIGGLDLRVMDAERLELEDRSFDMVFGSGILHHLDLDRAFPEIARVLRPDGRAVFIEPLGHNPAINLYRRLTPAMRTVDEHPLLARDLAEAGRWFGRVDVEWFHLATMAAVPLRSTSAFPRVLTRLERVDEAVFARVPAARRLAWTCVLVLADPR
jgi:SAM-dependent methyltransferase